LGATQAKVQAMAALTDSFISLQKALGLGWQGAGSAQGRESPAAR
jgi:hypothetical protein